MKFARNLKFTIVTILALFMFFSQSIFAYAVSQQDLNNAKAQQQQAQAAANQKAAEAAQMKSQITVITGQINSTQSALDQTNGDISSTQGVINDLSNQITAQENKLAEEKNKLNQIISSWYMEGNVGFFETLFSSDNLSAMVSKQQYYDSIKQQVNNTMIQINDLKAKLATQKSDQQKKMADLQSLQQQQTSYKQSVVSQKDLQTQMLNMTQTQQQQYLALAAKLQNDISHISAELYASRQKSSPGTPGALGYPYMQPPGVYVLDPWNFYESECTGYAAWYWNSRGKHWINTRPGSGSAWNWPVLAADQGYSVSQTPRVGAIISWQAGSLSSDWGHVAIVEAVNGDGTINVSEYNWSYNHGGDIKNNLNPASRGGYSYIY